jgi:hypothetical protein
MSLQQDLLLEVGLHHDDIVQTYHLQLEIGVVGHGHEFRITWLPQDGVVGAREVNNLKCEGLDAKAGMGVKSDGQVDLPRWDHLLSRHDHVEGTM